jgi:precorrin-8X/cobalt-precorrin-8 methylmutase
MEELKPLDIEKRSFGIIDKELKEKNIILPADRENIIKRVIHASADFEYADTMYFSNGATERAKELLLSGCIIVTDTNMALSGINKKTLTELGCEAYCFMNDERIAESSKKTGKTRAYLSMHHAVKLFKEKKVMFVSGNAPTALIALKEIYDEKTYRPDFIIGVPVGFVNVVEAKEMIMETDIPCIINKGRKGGSNIAAAIVNALMYELKRVV